MDKATALEQLESSGCVWDIGQLDPATRRALAKAGVRHRAVWPHFFGGTIWKTCYLRKDHPINSIAKAELDKEIEQPCPIRR